MAKIRQTPCGPIMQKSRYSSGMIIFWIFLKFAIFCKNFFIPCLVRTELRGGWRELCASWRWTIWNIFVRNYRSSRVQGPTFVHGILVRIRIKSRLLENTKTLSGKGTALIPTGWYTGRTSPNTIKLIAERDDVSYCADSYADDLPYYDITNGKPLLMVPYTLGNSKILHINGVHCTSTDMTLRPKWHFDWYSTTKKWHPERYTSTGALPLGT